MHLLALIAGGIVIFGAGAVLGWFGHQVPPPTHALRETGYEFINPILLCNLDSSIPQNENAALEKTLQDYISRSASKDVGVYYLKPGAGKWAGINENESFSPASMLKVPIMTAVLRDAEEHPDVLSKKFVYDGSTDNNAQEDIKPAHPLLPGSYTIKELLQSMIGDSDNNATGILAGSLTPDEFNNIYSDLGIAAPSVNGPIDFMSPKSFTLFLRLLYNATYLSRDDSQMALKLMSQSDFPQGLRAGVPAGVTVASKFGERSTGDAPNAKELHDCGIVYASSGPYFLCVMTRGSDFSALAAEIAGISKLVFEHQ